jgi:hypothetical protein
MFYTRCYVALIIMKRKFKMEVTFEIDGDISTEQFKNDMMRKIDEFIWYNDETDDETTIEVFDYWNSAIVTEIS